MNPALIIDWAGAVLSVSLAIFVVFFVAACLIAAAVAMFR